MNKRILAPVTTLAIVAALFAPAIAANANGIAYSADSTSISTQSDVITKAILKGIESTKPVASTPPVAPVAAPAPAAPAEAVVAADAATPPAVSPVVAVTPAPAARYAAETETPVVTPIEAPSTAPVAVEVAAPVTSPVATPSVEPVAAISNAEEPKSAVYFDGFKLADEATATEKAQILAAAQDNKANFKTYVSVGSTITTIAKGGNQFATDYNVYGISDSAPLGAASVTATIKALDAIVTREAALASETQAVVFEGTIISDSSTKAEAAGILAAAEDNKLDATAYARMGAALRMEANKLGGVSYFYNNNLVLDGKPADVAKANAINKALDNIVREYK